LAKRSNSARRTSRVQEKRDAARIQATPAFTVPSRGLIDPRTLRASILGTLMLSAFGPPVAFALLAVEVPPAIATADVVQLKDEPALRNDTRPGTIRRAGDGLFYVELRANGAQLRCMVDTGASDLVFSSAEAERVGLALDDLDYDHKVITAGGARAAARTRLKSIDVAGHHFEGVRLVLVKNSSTPCLMGQDLLARLDAVEIHADELRLR
jgi:clan AA aspartic protease (TIGR02281 family)